MPTRGETLAALRHAIEAHTPGVVGGMSDDALWNEVVSRRPDVMDKIDADPIESPRGGGHPLAQLGQGMMDASARMVNNAGKLVGLQTPERAEEINAQLTPETGLQGVGQVAPSLALAASVPGAQGGLASAGLNALTGAGITALDTGDITKSGEAGVASAALGGVGSLASKITPAAKWGLVNSGIKALKGGGLGAVAGAYAGRNSGVEGALKDAALGAVLQRMGVSDASKSATTKLQQAIKSGSDSNIARILWRLLPPAVAHATGEEQSFEDARNSLAPTDTKSLAALAKRRLEAQSVIR